MAEIYLSVNLWRSEWRCSAEGIRTPSWCHGKIQLYLNCWKICSVCRIKLCYLVTRTITERWRNGRDIPFNTFQSFLIDWMAEFPLVFVVLLGNKSLKGNCKLWGQHSSKYSISWSVRRRTVKIIRFTYHTKKTAFYLRNYACIFYILINWGRFFYSLVAISWTSDFSFNFLSDFYI